MSAISLSCRIAQLPRAARARLALTTDAVVTGVNGVVYLAAAAPLEDLLGTPASLLRAVGAFLLAFAAVVRIVSNRPARRAILAVVAVDVVWVLDSVLYAALTALKTAGTVWVLLQAAVVAGFALSAWAAAPASEA